MASICFDEANILKDIKIIRWIFLSIPEKVKCLVTPSTELKEEDLGI